MMTPLMAVYKHVPKLPQLGPEDPGPFAFADEARVTRILGEAGFADIAMEACPLSFDVAAGKGIDARRAGRAARSDRRAVRWRAIRPMWLRPPSSRSARR